MTGSFMCHCGNKGVEQTANKSQRTKLTLEKKNLPLTHIETKAIKYRHMFRHRLHSIGTSKRQARTKASAGGSITT